MTYPIQRSTEVNSGRPDFRLLWIASGNFLLISFQKFNDLNLLCHIVLTFLTMFGDHFQISAGSKSCSPVSDTGHERKTTKLVFRRQPKLPQMEQKTRIAVRRRRRRRRRSEGQRREKKTASGFHGQRRTQLQFRPRGIQGRILSAFQFQIEEAVCSASPSRPVVVEL